MSDSESSMDSFEMMKRNLSTDSRFSKNEDNDKIEEFDMLFRSMIESRGSSLEDEEGLEEGNEDKNAEMSGPENPTDVRLEFIGAIVQKSLKLKPEKWGRLLMTEEHRNCVLDFLDNSVPAALFVVLTPNAQLIPSCGFPIPCQRSKGVYTIKVKISPVPNDQNGCSSMLITGDLSHRVVDELATLVDNIFSPLLSKKENHKALPEVALEDINRHVYSLRGTLYQVKGQVNGRTVLPMPAGLEKVSEVERLVTSEGPQAVDLYLKSSIEGVVIKWAYLVNDVVTQESSTAFENGQNPTPDIELEFWNKRLANLRYIYNQLREERVKKMAIILEMTESAYFPCFRTLFENVVSSLAEAKELALYLAPLSKFFKSIEETDFAEAKPLMAIVIHVVGLAWAKTKYYQNSSKLIIMLRQISNLLIQEARRFLDPTLIFQSDVDEALQRVQVCRDVLEEFKRQFELQKQEPGMKSDSPSWKVDPNMIFARLDAFLKRLANIEWLFHTVLEFSKLEKIEIGGILGRSLSARIVGVFKEFQQLFSSFTTRSTDVLEPDDESFAIDCEKFSNSIVDLDSKLASILCQAFDDCHNLESVFKLINIAGTVLERPVICKQFTNRYSRILDLLKHELTMVEVLFNLGSRGAMSNLPPLAAGLQFTSMLRQRIDQPIQAFKSLQHPIVESHEGKDIIARYERLTKLLNEKEDSLFYEWAKVVPEVVDKGLSRPLLTRDSVSVLSLNFDPDLLAVLKEVTYLKQMCDREIPKIALEVSETSEIFRNYRTLLGSTVSSYNNIRKTSRRVEFNLIELEVAKVDSLVSRGENELCWKSAGLSDYISELGTLVENLWGRVKASQINVDKVQTIFEPWIKTPLFERKDRRKDLLLSLDERSEKVSRRYKEIENAAQEIHALLAENQRCFEISDKENEAWKEYVVFIDGLVMESLRKTVGCSLSYMVENMDPVGLKEPLLEASLELREPDLYYVPSLEQDDPDGLERLVSGLLADIIGMATLVPRLQNGKSYADELEEDEDIKSMKEDILVGMNRAIEEATDFCGVFEGYAYLWLEDRETVMQQFLEYSRQLTLDEMEMIAALDPKSPEKCPPKMENFREQIDLYEGLYLEIEEMEPSKVFCGWFRVDLRPFKQSLLNTVCKWSSMFKKHLVERVTSSLADLGNFIRLADEGLLQQIQPGDYAGLVSVMGYLMQVKERQPTTDEMFQPLQETVELLKFYDQDIPEEVNVLLQELPDQWTNTKKLAQMVKQQVAPLQAGEVSRIRGRISAFDTTIVHYREAFRRYGFFKFSCENPYEQLDEADKEICMLERQMNDIQESASLFEVTVPEFKQLKQCRRELKMLKQLWDYVNIVRSSIEGWKTTPWRKIDVENMDIECKKFAKEIRGQQDREADIKEWGARHFADRANNRRVDRAELEATEASKDHRTALRDARILQNDAYEDEEEIVYATGMDI